MANDMSLEELERHVRFNTRCTTVLLALFAVLLVGVGIYVWLRGSSALRAENLVDLAEKKIRKSYPEVRTELKTAILDNATSVAEKLSQRGLKSIPAGRAKLERYLENKIDEGLTRATTLSAREFRELLRDNREWIQEGYQDLRAAPQETKDLVLRMEKAFEKWAGTDIQKDARVVLGFLYMFRDKLEVLGRDEKNLTPKQVVERRIVRDLRALQVQ